MKNSGQLLLCTIALPIAFTLVLATSGCATKSYARQQAAVVNQRVSKVEKKTNEEVAYLTNKHETDISQVNERISGTDVKLGEVANRPSKPIPQPHRPRKRLTPTKPRSAPTPPKSQTWQLVWPMP